METQRERMDSIQRIEARLRQMETAWSLAAYDDLEAAQKLIGDLIDVCRSLTVELRETQHQVGGES